MSKKRFERWNDHSCKVKDNQEGILLSWEDVVKKLNEQQSLIQSLKEEIRLLKPTNIEQYEQIVQLQDEIDKLKKDIDIYEYEEKKHSETVRKLYKENEQLKQKVDFYKYFQKDARELEKENEQLQKQIQNYEQLISNSTSKKQCCDCEHFVLSKDSIFRVITGICGRCGKEVGCTDQCLFEEESFDKYLTERLNEKEEIIKEQERRIIVLENLLTNIGVKWVDDDE